MTYQVHIFSSDLRSLFYRNSTTKTKTTMNRWLKPDGQLKLVKRSMTLTIAIWILDIVIELSKYARVVDALYFNLSLYVCTYTSIDALKACHRIIYFQLVLLLLGVSYLNNDVIWYYSSKNEKEKNELMKKKRIDVGSMKVLCSIWSAQLIDFNNRFCLHHSKWLHDTIYVKWYDLHTLVECLEMIVWCWVVVSIYSLILHISSYIYMCVGRYCCGSMHRQLNKWCSKGVFFFSFAWLKWKSCEKNRLACCFFFPCISIIHFHTHIIIEKNLSSALRKTTSLFIFFPITISFSPQFLSLLP